MNVVRTHLVRLLAVLLATVALVLPGPAAHAADGIDAYAVDAAVQPDGALRVRATMTPIGTGGEVVQRFATTRESSGGRDYRFTLHDVRAVRNGQDAGAVVTKEPGYDVVTIPLTDAAPVTLEYTVTGAAFETDGGTAVVWRLLQGLSLPVQTFDATVSVPAPITMVDCAAGSPASPGACGWYAGGTHDDPMPTFHDGPRGAGEVVQVEVRLPEGAVAVNQDVVQRWTLDRAFSTRPFQLLVALGLAIAGALGLWALKRMFDAAVAGRVDPVLVGTFRPVGAGRSAFEVVEGVRPGEVGTLADGSVDPVDVTATLLDLAINGALTIRELPRESPFARTDWEFVPRADATRPLLPFEERLLSVIAPATSTAACRVSRLPEVVHDGLPTLQDALYDQVVDRGWYSRRPDDTRSATARAGWVALGVAVVIAALLVAFTTFGLAGLVLIALAAGLGAMLGRAPSRTPKGREVLAGLDILRGELLTQPTDEMPEGHEVAELSEVLPFAIVLGGTERWLDGLAATDIDDTPDETVLDWYHGPQGWSLGDLPDSLRNFVTTVEGILVQR